MGNSSRRRLCDHNQRWFCEQVNVRWKLVIPRVDTYLDCFDGFRRQNLQNMGLLSANVQLHLDDLKEKWKGGFSFRRCTRPHMRFGHKNFVYSIQARISEVVTRIQGKSRECTLKIDVHSFVRDSIELWPHFCEFLFRIVPSRKSGLSKRGNQLFRVAFRISRGAVNNSASYFSSVYNSN